MGKAVLETDFHNRFIKLREEVLNEVKAGAGLAACEY